MIFVTFVVVLVGCWWLLVLCCDVGGLLLDAWVFLIGWMALTWCLYVLIAVG